MTGVHNCLVQDLYSFPNDNYSFDPMIADPENGDFSLSDYSGAIGLGVNQYFNYSSLQYEDVPIIDFYGNPRPQPEGSMPDLGPIESSWGVTPYPDAPQDLVAIPLDQSAELNWSVSNATDVSEYFIYQSSDSASWTRVDSVIGRLNTQTVITGLANRSTYYFYVTAIDTESFESLPSWGVSVVPKYQGPVWYVNNNALPNGEGNADTPFQTIRNAVEVSNDGDTILILPGTYNSPFGDRDINLQDVPFGSDPLPYVRNLVIMSSAGPDSTIIELDHSGSFLTMDQGETSTELIGLTIQNGINTALQIGSNQTLVHTEVSVRNCRFINNSGNRGGAINVDTGSKVNIYDCLFEGNNASERGGAINSWDSNIFVQNSIFINNSAPGGGAIYNDNNSGLSTGNEIVHSLFMGNNGTSNDGYGVAIVAIPLYIYNSIFFGNISGEGTDHEMWHGNGAPVVVDHCILQSETQVLGSGENWIFDPMIVDPDNGDFSLSEYSPAIGRGRATYPDVFLASDVAVPNTDYLGNPRPRPAGSLPDLGPIEHERDVQRYFVYSVTTDGNDFTGDGLTTPFQTIQRAINEISDFDTVEVGPGTYAGTGNTQLDFFGAKAVLRSMDGPQNTIIDCENNSFGMEFSNGEGPEVMVEGFTIKRGATPEGGSGIRILGSSPTLRNLVLVNNATSGTGSAVGVDNGEPRFINCIIFGNSGNGGAVFTTNSGHPVFEHCTILNNTGNDGSGAFVVDGGALTIHNSIVWGNSLNGEEITDIPGTSAIDVSHSIVMGDYPGTAVFNGRPALVNPATGDFSLEDYSPGIGLADTSAFEFTDIFGDVRSVSDTTAPDVGAVESPLARPDTSGYAPLTFWVDVNGDDASNGLLPADAFATIQRAVNFAIWGDTVKLLPGHYMQDFKTDRKNITVMGAGPLPLARISGTAHLNGGAPVLTKLAFRGTDIALEMSNSSPELTFLEFSNNNGSPGLFVLQNSTPYLDHVTVADNVGNLYEASDSTTISMKNSVVFNTGSGTDTDGTTTFDITYSLTGSSGTGNLDTEPQFRAFSYRLLARSLLINAGDPNDQDADGTRADMGAYPYLTNHGGPDWFVSELGNDTTGTGSEFDPFASVQAGLNFAQSGDTIWVAAGTYMGISQVREADIAVIGDDWETTVLTGDESGNVFTFSGIAADTVWIQDLMITGSGTGYSGVNVAGATSVLDHVWIRGNDQGVVLDQSSATLSYCMITDNTGAGLSAIEGLPVLVNNTIANNGSGIVQMTAARSVTDSVSGRNVILWNNGGNEITGNVALTFSDFSGGSGDGNIDQDPLFTDDINGDYALDLLSPCIDAGDSTDSFDADSTVRDMGAIPAIRTFLGGTTTDNIDVSPDTVIIVEEDLTIAPDDTLTIEPGGILYLGDGVTLMIEGELDAQGNQSGPVQFSTLYPGETFGGIRIQGGSARTIPVYRYISISNVMTDSIPLVINGSAILDHLTIAGNDPAVASLQVNGGTVDLNYCILESGASGTVVNNNSYTNSTDQFVDWANGDFNLVPTAAGIDIGSDEASAYVDPDFTYTDAGTFYHDQSAYPVTNIDILYPANGTTVLVSPDTSALVGLTTEVQLFNQYGRYKTNGHVFWNENNTFGFFNQDSTTATDLDGIITNSFTTSTAAGDANTFVVSADGVSSEVSGTFLIEPGVPDSIWVNDQTDTVMTQLDTLGFSAWIYDQFENLVRDGETVNWSVVPVTGNGNGFVLSSPQSTTLAGLGSIDLLTDPNTALQVGDQVRIQAESNGAVHQSGTITIVPDDIFSLTMPSALTENPIDLSADVASILLSATLVDTFDNPLEGVDVNWAVMEGAGTGENLSANMTTTDASGYTEVTLTTGTVSGLQYRVETWITQGALLSALRNGAGSATTSGPVEHPDSKGTNSTVKTSGTKGTLSGVRLAVKGRTLYSAGIGQDSGNGYSTESIFGLRDTTAVITVVPGVTATVTLPVDSVDVVRKQTFDVSLTAVDQFGNHVANGTAVGWEIIPSTSNVTITGSDNVTTDGSAIIHLEIDSSAVWEFDFNVRATVEGITSTSGTFNVDDQIAPAAPLTLAITPNVWTSTNSFDLTWANPVEHSGIAGVHYQVDSEQEVYVAGNDIATLTDIVLPQNGISTLTLWLEDLAGNTDNANATSIIAKWDDTAPDGFNLISPLAGWYNNNTPELKWNASSDATAGLRNYRLNLDGSPTEFDPAIVSYQIATALSEGSHSWSVFAVDSAGNETEASNPQTIQVDVTAPSIAHNPALEGNANTPVPITASFSDTRSGIDRAELYYRKGGELTWQPAVDMKTLNTYQIASSFVTSVGVEYYLETEDVAGNITRKPETGFYSISVTVGGTGIASADRWPTGITNGTGVQDYQLISFPMQAANNTPTDILVDDLGNYDKTKWRFFTYEAGTWLEFADITSIDPGQSYFLIVKDPGLSINTGQVRSVDTDASFVINLTAGDWTFIGNPFNFDISLDMITVQDTVSLSGDPNLYTWDTDWVAPTKLKPWNGYIYKSVQGGQLKINPRNATGRMMPKSMVLEPSLDENEWLVTITATNGSLHDRNNQIGVLNSAQDGFDRLDAFEPPVVPGNVALRIDDRNWAEVGDVYRRDIRTPNEDGRYWDLEVLSGDPESPIEVQFAGLSDIPEGFEIFVVDLTLKTAQNLRWDPNLRFASSSTGLVHRLRFIAGTREFAEANSGGVSLVPDAYTVSQNFPNPFNPQTTINLGLEEGARIHLAIYNILGQEVAVLANDEYRPAGYYSFIWKGRNYSGQRVASGVYFYITEVTSPTGVSLLRDTRKMILVK
ncbi:MAG: DUF1565 domain-containing protein [FCB group bacterium]|nr:DUF1565 domain-containing protein [FCB group bacterium]